MLLNYNSPQIDEKSSATFVHLRVNSIKYKVIVDSGAESTLMDNGLAKKLKSENL